MHKFWISSENEEYNWGPPVNVTDRSRMTKKVFRFDDQKVRPMGFFGSYKFDGLTSLGVIQFNEDCIPANGEYVEPEKEDL